MSRITPYLVEGSVELKDDNSPVLSVPRFQIRFTPQSLLKKRFGSLVLAKHQGIASLGFVMAVGTATCVVAALTLLPASLRLLTQIGWLRLKKKPSDQTGSPSLGWEEPR